ncbi:hypothetical protein WJX73_007449 [Symbiochloris irregularis]|uniref:Uncharacterized protein n=1 Tax=Symbiochloris irregularis TaxID=706552 RepID=A0AAW1PIR0_9CHLO
MTRRIPRSGRPSPRTDFKSEHKYHEARQKELLRESDDSVKQAGFVLNHAVAQPAPGHYSAALLSFLWLCVAAYALARERSAVRDCRTRPLQPHRQFVVLQPSTGSASSAQFQFATA